MIIESLNTSTKEISCIYIPFDCSPMSHLFISLWLALGNRKLLFLTFLNEEVIIINISLSSSARGPLTARQYNIRWKDYTEEYDTWEPRSNIHPELIRDYEIENNVYEHEWRFRCEVCDLPCASARGVTIHKARIHKSTKQQNFSGTLAEEAVKVCKLVKQQENRPDIHCDGEILKNVFKFKYLGTIFTADAEQKHDIKTIIAKSFSRCGKLRNVFDSQELSTKLKIRLYQAAVCSIFTFGCETWRLTPPVMRQINGANSRMLARLTGKTIPQEARPLTCSFNLVRAIRKRRLKWLGDILRAGPSRLTYQAVIEQKRRGLPGNLLMDAPPPFHPGRTNRKS